MTKKKRIAAIAGVILLVLIGLLAGYLWRATDYEESLKADPKEQSGLSEDYRTDINAPGNIVYLVVLGIDRTEDRDEWLGIYRTDAIEIVRLDLEKKNVRVLAIPRDTYTYVPIEGKMDKINHAYAYGSLKGRGVEESLNAINQLLGKNVINYYFLMDMEPIPNIVDEIGGVEIDVEIDMKDHGANLSKGLQVLNGQQAFDYIHWRYSGMGDIDRIKRQQKFMRALLKQQRESGQLLESAQILLKYRDDFKTDLSVTQIIGLARFMADVPNDGVEFSYIPGEPKMINAISYWVMYKGETQQVLQEFFRE